MDDHSLQSPFVFDIYREALFPSRRKKIIDASIEKLRKKLLFETRSIGANTKGSGSSISKNNAMKLNKIARSGISSRRQSEILVNLAETLGCKTVLELGTSLGLNAMYLAKSKEISQVVTVEGNDRLALEANKHFEEAQIANIKVVASDIDDFWDMNTRKFDMVYIDANHTFEATVRYFEKSLSILSGQGVIVIDDINWSPDMSKAWTFIVSNFENNITIENSKIGIVFVHKLPKTAHYILRF